MNLCSTSDSIRITTTTAATMTCGSSFCDEIGESKDHGYQTATSSSATTTTVVSPFTRGFRVRRITGSRIANTDAALTNFVTVSHHDGQNSYTLWRGLISPGEVLSYDGSSFMLYNTSGVPKLYAVNSPNYTAVLMSPFFSTANLTSVRSLTATNTYAVYVGKAPRSITSATVRCRVTTAMATITWGEVAIATGAINVGANPTLTVRGWTDVSGTFNSTGQKSTSVSVAAGQAINEGDDLWVLVGNNATTVAVVRAASIADDLQVGAAAFLATRPSLNVGNGQAYTIETATALSPWFALVV